MMPELWVRSELSSDRFLIHERDGALIAVVPVRERPERAARAGHLIAAAPELRDALKAAVMNHCPEDRLFCSTCTPARALLARIDAAPTS